MVDADVGLQLSREDEAAVSADETEVRREDQDKINKFSRLHQREMFLEDELKTKAVCLPLRHTVYVPYAKPFVNIQKDKEDLDEISNELELADEDAKIPYVVSLSVLCMYFG